MRYFKTTLMGKIVYKSPFEIFYLVSMPDRKHPVLVDPEFVRAPKDAPSLAPVFIPGELSGDRFVFLPGVFPENPEIGDVPSNTEGFPIVDEKTCETDCVTFSKADTGEEWLNGMLREALARHRGCKVDEISDDTVEKLALRIREMRKDNLKMALDESYSDKSLKSKKEKPSCWQMDRIFQLKDDAGYWWDDWDYSESADIVHRCKYIADECVKYLTDYADELDNGRMTPEEVRKAIVQEYPLAIALVRNPGEELCKIAVRGDWHALGYITDRFLQRSPCKSELLEELEKLAVSIDGRALQYVHIPAEELCIAAVLQKPAAMWFVPDCFADAAKKAIDESRGE